MRIPSEYPRPLGTPAVVISLRNEHVADVLCGRGLGALVVDLLTADESRTWENSFDVPHLTDRLITVTDWLAKRGGESPLGYFSSGTGAAAARRAASRRGFAAAIVSRGGRLDMAADVLAEIGAPTLLVVDEADTQVREINHDAFGRLACEKDLLVIEATERPLEGHGDIEDVAELAGDWFATHLS